MYQIISIYQIGMEKKNEKKNHSTSTTIYHERSMCASLHVGYASIADTSRTDTENLLLLLLL